MHKLKVVNTLFGGFFGSRLMKNIREEKGLTYGIHSGFVHLEHESYWHIDSEILSDKVGLAQTEILNELHKISTQPPGLEEFNMVKNYMKGKFLGSFDSPFHSHEVIKGLKLANLDHKNLTDFLDALDKMQANEVPEIASKHISADRLCKLIVK